ncbi:MAG TPA: ArsR family transcriptional regulator [Acidimicrobiia bacterium]|nr:ArsR family transcriptional regulator [Acidimicrobiia bacterium]
MRQVLALESREQIELLADDLKLAILEQAIHPTTVSAMAVALGVPRTRLYHHVNRLVDNNLLRVVRQRQVGPLVESQYQATALNYRVSRRLLESLSVSEVGAVLVSLVFGPAKAEFVTALQDGLFSLMDSKGSREVQVARHHMMLTHTELNQLIRELEELYARYDPDPQIEREGTIPVAAVSVVHPRRRGSG